MTYKRLILMVALPLLLLQCSKKDDEKKGFNLFSVNDDIAFGSELRDEIRSNPDKYPVLNPVQYADAYYHIYRIRDSILATGELQYGDRFDWEIDILYEDEVLNAFCTPGGYMCFYTGIIKFLDDESQFAGVMGHEMAHADRRHSTEQLTKAYGIQVLLGILLGNNPGVLADIAANLAAGVAMLAFSRDAEYESDKFSIRYLYNTSYDARGVGEFFKKIDGSLQPPEFLSTHPHPDNRLERIEEIWLDLGGKEGALYTESYQLFKNSLP